MESDALADGRELKVEELLKEVQLEYSPGRTKLVEDAVAAIKDAIFQIPEDFEVTADLAPGFIRDIGADNVEFKFKRPKSIGIGGSYSIRCIAKPDVNVDLFVRLPKACFGNKDYLDYRYHGKRCLYLCIVKKYLKISSFVDKVEWSTFQNEARKPVLVVHTAAKLDENHGISVRIIPTAKNLFKIPKLKLGRNNFCSLKLEGSTAQATPKYNSSILEDMFLEDNAEFINKIFSGWKELGEALILLKVWARQRSSIYAHDCLNGFLISVLMAFLVTQSGKNCINNLMKPIQIFRVTLDFIATSKVWENGLHFQLDGQKTISEEERRVYKQLFPVVICDPFAHFNFAFRMTSSGFLELQNEASLSISCLDRCKDGGFEELFMTRVDFPAKYDHCMRLNLKGNTEVCASGFCLDEECWRLYEQKIYLLLHQGLGDRSKFIRVNWRNTRHCNIEDGFSMFDREPLLIGISLSSVDNALRIVGVGPNAENKDEAIKFRKFWGEKAELRRFKDGTIAESTVWESKQWEKHLIIKRITGHVLLRHLSLSKENIEHIVDQLDFSLLHGVEDPISFSGNLLGVFEALSARLRQLRDIPLSVSSVQPLDSAFRFTSVFPPEPHPLADEKGVVPKLQKLFSTCIQPMEVLLQLEGSGNWPMDEVALEKTKSAFLLKIGESLQNRFGMTCTATEDDVDVFMSGYAFRLKILHERGLSMMKRQSGSTRGKWVPSTDRKLFFHSQHASMINGLQGRFQTYGPIVRLAKRWIASHLFSACLAEEAVELLVAHVFSKPLPFDAPCSRISGFLRFLRLLSEHDWTFSSLVVDINNDLGAHDKNEIDENFMMSRKAYKPDAQDVNPAMFLGTAYDKASEAWTWSSPNSYELKRLVAYARSSASLLTKLVLEDHNNDSYRWECLLRTPLNNYDALILLHRDRLAFPQRLLFPSEPNQGTHVACGSAGKDFHPFLLPADLKGSREELKYKLMVDFDPLRCYIGDLEKEFPNEFKLWYDSLGGDAIGLTWDRSCSKKRVREEVGKEAEDPISMLRTVGGVGTGFVRSVHFLKAPRVGN